MGVVDDKNKVYLPRAYNVLTPSSPQSWQIYLHQKCIDDPLALALLPTVLVMRKLLRYSLHTKEVQTLEFHKICKNSPHFTVIICLKTVELSFDKKKKCQGEILQLSKFSTLILDILGHKHDQVRIVNTLRIGEKSRGPRLYFSGYLFSYSFNPTGNVYFRQETKSKTICAIILEMAAKLYLYVQS